MATIVQMTGFEHGSHWGLLNGVSGLRQFDSSTGTEGTNLIVQSANTHLGGYALRCVATTSQQANVYWTTASLGTPTVLVGRFWFCVENLTGAGPTDLPALMHISTPVGAGSTSYLEYDEPTGNLRLTVGGGTTQIATAAVTVGSWVCVDFRFDCSGTTWTWDWSVNGVAKIQATWAHAASTVSEIRFGINSAYNIQLCYDDITLSTTAADYPLPDTHITALPVNGSGTHNISGDFLQTTNNGSSGVAISSPELIVDDRPPTVGGSLDAVYQNIASASAYLEFTHSDIGGGTVHAVKHVVAGWVASAAAKNLAVVLQDSGSAGSTLGTTSVPIDPGWAWSSTVLGWANKTYAAPPSGGVWTPAAVNALTTRVGYATSIAGLPGINAVYLEVAQVAQVTVSPKARVYNTLAGPNAAALTVPAMPTSAGNAGGVAGWAPDFVNTLSAGSALTYSNTHLRNGGNALHVTTGTTTPNAYCRWSMNNGGGTGPGEFQTAATTIYGWCDVWFDVLPTVGPSLLAVVNTSGAIMAQLRVLGTGSNSTLVGRDSTNSASFQATTSGTATGKLLAAQWNHVEWKVVLSATAGQIEVRLFQTPGGAISEAPGVSGTNLNMTGTLAGGVTAGIINAQASMDYYLANVGWSDVGYPTQYQTTLSRWAGSTSATGFKVVSRTVNTASVRLKVSTSSDLLTSPVFSSAVVPDANGLAKTTITGLTANTVYFYGMELDGVVDLPSVGTLRTYPVAGSPASYSFAAASCAKTWSNDINFDQIRTRTGSAGAGSRTALFFQHLGDLNYRDITANNTVLFNQAWDEVMSSPRQQALYSSTSTHYTWSDHDSGGGSNNDGTAVAHVAAQSVYRNRVPSYTLPAVDNAGIYFSYVIGRVRYIVTDGRSYMSPIAQTDNSSKTKLGSTQKDWLKSELLQPEPVKVWFHEDSWNNGATYIGDDTWGAYNTERTELASFINVNGVRVLFIHGDLHVLAADDGTNSPGGLAVFCASPLDQTTYAGNGTYSAGVYPVPQSGVVFSQQYGWFDVVDNGQQITITATGYDSGGASHITMTKTYTAPSGGAMKVWNGTTWVHAPVKVWNGTTWAQAPVKVWNGTSWVTPTA